MGYKFNPTTGKLDIVSDPGGSNTSILFNDNGTFGGDVDLTYNKTTNLLTTKGDILLDDGGSFSSTLQMVTPTANRIISLPDATGTVALVGGSSGQITYNLNGANAGLNTLTADSSGNLTLSARLTNVFNSIVGVSAKLFSGTWASGGSATTTKPHVLIEPAGTTSNNWSTAGTGLGVNAPSGYMGNLLDLQLNSVSRLSVSKTGQVAIQSDSDMYSLVIKSSGVDIVGLRRQSSHGMIDVNNASGSPKCRLDGRDNFSSYVSYRFGINTTAATCPLDIAGDSMRLQNARTPASATATGLTGEISWDANYIYVCTATNTWKRVAISSW
jgi:hypothetical protein